MDPAGIREPPAQCLSRLHGGRPASGAWTRGKRLWAGARAFLRRLRKRRLLWVAWTGRGADHAIRFLRAAQSPRWGTSPARPKRQRPALGGARAPSRGDGLSPSPCGPSPPGAAGAFLGPERSRERFLSTIQEHARMGTVGRLLCTLPMARPSSREGGGQGGGVQPAGSASGSLDAPVMPDAFRMDPAARG